MTVNAPNRAAELRRVFDDAFAKPPPETDVQREQFLAIRVAGEPFAVRMLEISALVKKGKVVPVPSATPSLMGITGMRGALLPVYSLPALLGFSPAAETHWLAVCGSIGLAFSEFENYFEAAPGDLSHVAETESRLHLKQLVRAASAARLIVDIPSVLSAIRHTNNSSGTNK